jgi:7-carboxy-7-deazaguanine synthase
MYDLTELTNTLHEKGFKVHIETSGRISLNGTFDWVCFSPKKFKKPVSNFGLSADELKIIVFNKSDFEWAESYRKEVKSEMQTVSSTGMGQTRHCARFDCELRKK